MTTLKKYEVAWNTGDYNWNDEPKYKYFDTIEEVEKEINREFTLEERKALENEEVVIYDEYEEEYRVSTGSKRWYFD